MESQKHDHAKMFECKFRYAKKCYKRGLHKYSSFPWFLNPNITYIFYRAKLHKSGLYHNFWLDCTSDLNWVFLNCILIALFRDTPLAHLSCHLIQSTWHLKIQVLGAGTWHLAHHLNLVSGVSLKRAFKMQFRNAYFRSLVHSSQKLWPKPD